MDNLNESHNQGINIAVQSLNVLAQCAVGVFSVIGTITVALAGVGIEKKKLIYLIIAIIVDAMSIFFHRQFKKWASPYVFQIMLCDDDNNHYSTYGLKVLSCYLFDVSDWSNLKTAMMTYIQKTNRRRVNINKATIKQLNSKTRKMGSKNKLGHIGVLTALWISEIMLIVFVIICALKLRWGCF